MAFCPLLCCLLCEMVREKSLPTTFSTNLKKRHLYQLSSNWSFSTNCAQGHQVLIYAGYIDVALLSTYVFPSAWVLRKYLVSWSSRWFMETGKITTCCEETGSLSMRDNTCRMKEHIIFIWLALFSLYLLQSGISSGVASDIPKLSPHRDTDQTLGTTQVSYSIFIVEAMKSLAHSFCRSLNFLNKDKMQAWTQYSLWGSITLVNPRLEFTFGLASIKGWPLREPDSQSQPTLNYEAC